MVQNQTLDLETENLSLAEQVPASAKQPVRTEVPVLACIPFHGDFELEKKKRKN